MCDKGNYSKSYIECVVKFLSYPKKDWEIGLQRYKELQDIGVSCLLFEGKLSINGCKILGKGTNAVIIKVKYENSVYVLKVLRLDASRRSLYNEAEILKRLEAYNIAPKIIKFSSWFILEEYIEGVPIADYLNSDIYLKDVKSFKRVIYDLLNKCRLLDSLGIDHGELGKKGKHVIIQPNNTVKIIDFESASTTRKPRNLSTIIQYIFYKTDLGKRYIDLINRSFAGLAQLIREYKDGSENAFRKLCMYLDLLTD